MELKEMDLVYPLLAQKPGNGYEELRYSLRSVCKYLPHRKVVIVGRCLPGWLKTENVLQLPVPDDGTSKAENARKKLEAVSRCQDISESFILMNDDFFLLNEVEEIPAYSLGSIYSHLEALFSRHALVSTYMENMVKTGVYLHGHGLPTEDYGVHCPMVMERSKLLEALKIGGAGNYLRTLYGNLYIQNPVLCEDFKINDLDAVPDPERPYASTSDDAFRRGKAGKAIKELLPVKCQYEK